MTLRSWLWQVVSGSAAVNADVPASRVHGSGSLREPPGDVPFIVIVFMPSTEPVVRGTRIARVQIWVHDRGGSYVRIDRVLRAIQETMEGTASDGTFIKATWEGDSNDVFDEAMNTNARYAQFRIASRSDS